VASFEHTLVADLADRVELARLVRVALAQEVGLVPLLRPPPAPGQYMLQLRVAGMPGVSLAAEIAGAATAHGWPLRLAPLDPSHIRELEAIVDELPLSLAPLSKSESAIFDSKPPLPSAPRTVFDPPRADAEEDEPLGESVLFDPEAALVSRPSHRPAATAGEDTLTVPHRPSMQPTPSKRGLEEWKKTDPSATHLTEAARAAVARELEEEQGHAADDDGISVVFGDENTIGATEISASKIASAKGELRAQMEVGLTPTEPFPPQDLTEWRRKQALGMEVNEDTGTLPSSSQGGARSISHSSARGPRTQRRQFPVIGVGRFVGNKYRIEAPIGSGAVGAVYRASHGDLGRQVAIKVLHPHCRTDPHLLASFRAEARAASLLDHPNVTVVHDFGEDPDGTVYIVMEYLPGATLQAVLDEERRLVPKRAIAIMLQVCAALAAAHERGIVHRDVKPDNIILVQSRDDEGYPFEVAKVCDFGIAALAGPGLTMQGDGELTAGTPEYMAPEQALGRADARTDVYACGIVLYEMLTGRPPFVGATPKEILARHANETARRISEAVVVDARLEALVMRALEKQPERRFATMRELRAALKKLVS
jgi:hypothetical protein